MLLCRYVSQVLVVRIPGGIQLEHVLRKICDRWDNLCIGSFSLFYVLDGSDCKLDNEESFDNMLYLYPTIDRIHAKVEVIKSCSGQTVGSISSGGTLGSISSGVEVGSSSGAVAVVEREEPLEEFCRHAETSPQADVLADSEVELENVLVGIVSSTHVLGLQAPPSPVLQQVLKEDSDDSEAELLEVLEGVVGSVINDSSNPQMVTTPPTSNAHNPNVNTPSKQSNKAAHKDSKAAWSDSKFSQQIQKPDGDEKEPPGLLHQSDVKLLLGGSSKAGHNGKQRSHSKGSQKKRK
ncbi:hypothetical protein RHMOL_Rhmol13G0153300 [Rhododendron molle]|uniref:Uncharacterized protein n=1 Tax=Rhododendron molle TaxID=49168 RepID=A0ACC0L7I1_RHOML|nr:hypothetical protein RHMOL_Rhmol13G0153300 [Rhododendron molle]